MQYILAKAIAPPPRPLLCRHYKLKNSSRGPWQCEAVLAFTPSGKSLSTGLWILLASWHVTLEEFVASTMRTCLVTTCALALAPVCSGVLLAYASLPPSLQLTSTTSVYPPPVRLLSRLRLRDRGPIEVRGHLGARFLRAILGRVKVYLRFGLGLPDAGIDIVIPSPWR